MINILTALPAEAKPLIDHFRLKRVNQVRAYPLYCAQDIQLMVSGMGKIAAAMAVGYLQALQQNPETPSIWLNVGVAGHRDRMLGEAVLAHRIQEESSGHRYYPTLLFDPPCPTDEVLTVEQAQLDYPQAHTYDMEAAGFYQAALRFSSSELVHCLKLISDNPQHPAALVTAQQVQTLVADKVSCLDALVRQLRQLDRAITSLYSEPDDFARIARQFHITVTQQNQLKKQLRHWYALTDTPLLDQVDIHQHRKVATLLGDIESRLRSLPVLY
jgi:nucleoside phosphorylase